MQLTQLKTIAAVIFMICSASVFAQSTANSSATATVIAPIALSKNVDMNFGNAAVAVGTGGSVVLAPSSTRTTTGGGVTLPASSGTVSAAKFTVTGAPGFTFAITLPGSAVINGPGAATMTVNSFTSIPSSTGTIGSGGAQSLNVGATLYVAPAQAAGIYTNLTALPVTVNYN